MSKEMKLDENTKLDIHEILDDLANYRPRRRGWSWRTPVPRYKMHNFEYHDMAESLKKYVPLPSAKYFDNIDPQGTSSITTEIPQVVLKMIFAECGWPHGMEPII